MWWGKDRIDDPGWESPFVEHRPAVVWQACPCCNGTGLRSIPPGIAGDQESFTSNDTGPWPCGPCGGKGLLRVSQK